MRSDRWPLFQLRIRTPRLELRYPADDDLAVLVERAAEQVHEPDFMPFTTPWTRTEPPLRERAAGAVEADTSAFADTPASLGVTRSLGYRPNGAQLDDREGAATRHLRFLLTSTDWEAQRRADIEIDNLGACRDFLRIHGGPT